MNREDVIRMAREADVIDFRDDSDDPHVAQMVEFLERFADLVAAAEREACAQICDDVNEPAYFGYENPNSFDDGRRSCAAAIRARRQP
jgi:hypothetical protein